MLVDELPNLFASFRLRERGWPLRAFELRDGYNIAGLLFFFLFLDNLLRHIDGQGWGGFWPCSGRVEAVVLYAVLSLLAQLAYWSRIVSRLNQEHP